MSMFSGWPLRHTCLILLGISALAACHREEDTAAPKQRWPDSSLAPCPSMPGAAKEVTLEELTTRPGEHEGELVRVAGYYYDYFEHSALHPEPEVESYSSDFNTQIWLDGMNGAYSDQHVQLAGVFSAKTKGHLGQWPGTLCVVSILKLPRAGDDGMF